MTTAPKKTLIKEENAKKIKQLERTNCEKCRDQVLAQLRLEHTKFEILLSEFTKSHTAMIRLSPLGRNIDEYIDLLMKITNDIQYEWFVHSDRIVKKSKTIFTISIVAVVCAIITVVISILSRI
jgi:hypothetical protein